MTCTSIYAVFPDKKGFNKVEDFSNSWRGAALVWGELKKRYEDDLPEGGRYSIGDTFGWGRVWEYEEDGGTMEWWERNVLRSTYDRAVLRREYFGLMAESMEVFHRNYPGSSLLEQACALRRLYDQGATAVAWNQTNVISFLLNIYDEDADEFIPYDLETMGDHHFIDMAKGD